MSEQIIVVDGWSDIVPHHLRYQRAAGEPSPKPYVHKYPYAVIFFKKLKKEYHKEQLAQGLKPRVLVSASGERFELNALDQKTLKSLDPPKSASNVNKASGRRGKRWEGVVSIEW